MNNPPNVAGKWKIVEYKVVNGSNTIYDPIKIEYEANFEQNGRFVYSIYKNNKFYGVWKYLGNKKWSLIMIENEPDNDTFNFTPLCIKCNKVTKMDCVNYEAGTIENTSQNAQVSYSTWYRIN